MENSFKKVEKSKLGTLLAGRFWYQCKCGQTHPIWYKCPKNIGVD